MPQAVNSLTPFDAVVEERLVTFDYGINLADGVVITSVDALTCETVFGDDTTPAQRILTNPAIVNAAQVPYGSGKPTAAVSVKLGGMVAGTTYLVQCVVATSDNQELSLWQEIQCIEPS